jgi:hypothetical protein
MPKRKKQAVTAQPAEGDERSFTTAEALAFLTGTLIIFFLGLGTTSYVARSVCWRLKTKWFYQEGQCRVVKAEVARAETSWIVDVQHRVEVNGRQYQPRTNTEEETPEAYSPEEAEKLRARYEVGRLYPCWYNAADPEAYSVLLHDGLHPWEPLKWLWKPPLLALPGVLMCRWAWRRSKNRRTRADAGG